MARQVIHGLQVFRSIAAAAVVAHHTALSTDAFVATMPVAWMRVFDLGAFGVDFFFVLSGFIIMHAHQHEAGRPERLPVQATDTDFSGLLAYWLGTGGFVCSAAHPLGQRRQGVQLPELPAVVAGG